MKNTLYLCSLLFFCLCSCKKEKDEIPSPTTPTTPSSTNYAPLSIGSYWIYERFNLDTNGVETLVSIDSSYISGDTIIHGDTFVVFVGVVYDPGAIYFRRDSLGYLVDQYGLIYFSSTNFTDTLRTSSTLGYYNSFAKMVVPGSSVSTPAGLFSAFDFLGTVNIVSSGYPWDTTRYTHAYYSDGIGLIRETTFFFSAPSYIGRKLVRYHIQ